MDDPWLNIEQHRSYARSVEEVKNFERQFELDISKKYYKVSQPRGLLKIIPKFSALTLFLGTYLRKRWSRVRVPKKYGEQLATSHAILPIFDIEHLQEREQEKLHALQHTDPEDTQIPLLLNLLNEIQVTIKDSEEVRRRLQEFLQI